MKEYVNNKHANQKGTRENQQATVWQWIGSLLTWENLCSSFTGHLLSLIECFPFFAFSSFRSLLYILLWGPDDKDPRQPPDCSSGNNTNHWTLRAYVVEDLYGVSFIRRDLTKGLGSVVGDTHKLYLLSLQNENDDKKEILTKIQVRRKKHTFLHWCPRDKEITYLHRCVCSFISKKQTKWSVWVYGNWRCHAVYKQIVVYRGDHSLMLIWMLILDIERTLIIFDYCL